jgi:hypothetical protein
MPMNKLLKKRFDELAEQAEKVEVRGSSLTRRYLTDHYIRVVHAGAGFHTWTALKCSIAPCLS